MAAITKSEYLQAGIDAATSSYPVVAEFIKAGDPRILASLNAMAMMLAMRSAEVEVALYEPFAKVRDATVLADASLKGILPLARACRVSLQVTNNGTAAYALDSGRRLQDAKGRIFQVDAAASIEPGAVQTVAATQITTRTITQTVTLPASFYALEVTQTEDDVFLNSLAVMVNGETFNYMPEWFNVNAGDSIYQVETDERRRLWVRFGSTGVVGYGVQAGDEITLVATECEGRITDLTPSQAFSLEYSYTADDGLVAFVLGSVIDQGSAPPTMTELRTMARYPGIYDHNAVYLAEFELMLRRYLTGIEFLNVWNEQVEETVRGASEDNINTLFVSGQVSGLTNQAFQDSVTALINRADDSYRISFVDVVESPVSVTVSGTVAMVHDIETVKSQIRGLILGAYGAGQPSSSLGGAVPVRVQEASDLLRKGVPAFADARLGDFSVHVDAPATLLPEMWMYVSEASLTVDITRASYGNGLWNR